MASKSKVLAELSVENNETDYIDLPGGTTAQRPSPAGTGNLRYNTTTGLAEYYNGVNQWQSIDTPPTVKTLNPSGIAPDDTSSDIVITGSNFKSGATVTAISTTDGDVVNAVTVTVDSTTQITANFNGTQFTVGESYDIKVTNSGGNFGELANSFTCSNAPSWTTAAGNIGSAFSDVSASLSIAATDPEGDTLTYSIQSGSSLYGGLSLNSSTGAITGDPNPDVTSDTTNTFIAEVSDGASTINRTFNIIIKAGLGTANNPATSAKQLYDAGYTTDGNYYINNVFTNNTDVNCYCLFNYDFKGAGTGYHLQKFNPAYRAGESPGYSLSNVGPSGSTMSNISGTITDKTTYMYRYTTSSSSSGASSVVHFGLSAADTGQVFFRIDQKVNSYGDSTNPLGEGGIAFDTNGTGNTDSTGSTTYSHHWQSLPNSAAWNSGGGYLSAGYLLPSNTGTSAFTVSQIVSAYALGSSQDAAANSLADINSFVTNAATSQGTYSVTTAKYMAFKHSGWSDVGNSAQSDHIYWVAAAV